MSKFNLHISMAEAKQISLLKDWISSGIKIPSIKKIRIDYFSDEDKIINSFLDNWVSSQFELLLLNYSSISPAGVSMDLYINSITEAIKYVTKEIYLRCFEITETELEQIVKSAYNWERLIFRFCDIHCSKRLDFSISEKYNIKFLSFWHCGNTDYPIRKTDWKKNPSLFKSILDSISSCGLKSSLETIDIWGNDTLNKDELQLILNVLEMSHVNIVQTGADPS